MITKQKRKGNLISLLDWISMRISLSIFRIFDYCYFIIIGVSIFFCTGFVYSANKLLNLIFWACLYPLAFLIENLQITVV